MKLEVEGVSVSFPRRAVLKSIDLTLDEGEAILIGGPSGSGKTTLLRAIAGVIPEIYFGRVKGLIKPKLAVRKCLIAYLPQEPWYGVATPYVWSEVFSFTYLKREMNRIKRVLNDYGLSNLLYRTTYTLSAGELQRLAIVVARYSRAKILLLDEPVSHLDPLNSARVKEAVKKFVEEGNSAIIIDHKPDFWDGIISKAYLIRNGELKGFDESLYAPHIEKINSMDPPKKVGDEVLNVHIKQYRHPGSQKTLLHNVSISLNEGEIATVLGPSGVGKSSLLKIIASAILVPKRDISLSVRGGLLYVPDNPLLFYSEPTLLKEVGKGGMKYLREFGLLESATTPIGKLSTGERRRGAIASSLSRGFSIILMDEPTIGLDPLNKAKVMEALVKAAGEGLAFLIATHDRDLLKISNKVYRLE